MIESLEVWTAGGEDGRGEQVPSSGNVGSIHGLPLSRATEGSVNEVPALITPRPDPPPWIWFSAHRLSDTVHPAAGFLGHRLLGPLGVATFSAPALFRFFPVAKTPLIGLLALLQSLPIGVGFFRTPPVGRLPFTSAPLLGFLVLTMTLRFGLVVLAPPLFVGRLVRGRDVPVRFVLHARLSVPARMHQPAVR